MPSKRQILSDAAKLATSAAGLVQGAGREAEMLLRQRLERILDRMELVTREEFDAVKAMAATAREENDALAKRIAALEARLADNSGAKTTKTGGPSATAKRKTPRKRSPNA